MTSRQITPLRPDRVKPAMDEVASHTITLTDRRPGVEKHWLTGKPLRVYDVVLRIRDGSEFGLILHMPEDEAVSLASLALDWYTEVRLCLASRRRWKQLRPANDPLKKKVAPANA